METERNEVYERIPWETLEAKGGDRQWWMFALAGAIVLGALAYSFMCNRPVTCRPRARSTVPALRAQAPVAIAAPGAPTVAQSPKSVRRWSLPKPICMPWLPERILERATAHAEWFVAEYIGVDGSEESRQALAALMPAGVPAPAPPESTRVFVEWVRAVGMEELQPLHYRVTVLVRSLLANGEEPYRRLPPFTVTVDVSGSRRRGRRW